MLESIFILTPAYNASTTIEKMTARIPADVRARIKHHVIVNDGSKDGTRAVLAKMKEQDPALVILDHPVNRGYGGACKTLLSHALEHGADACIVLHADGQYSPELILTLLEPIEKGTADLVQGSRMLGGGALKGNMPLYKFIANKSLTAIENWAFGLKLAEYHSGYMLYARRTIEEIPFLKLSDSFDFDLEMIVMSRVKSLRIAEIAIPTIYADEVSNLDPIDYGMRVLRVVRDYRRGKYHALSR